MLWDQNIQLVGAYWREKKRLELATNRDKKDYKSGGPPCMRNIFLKK